MTIATTTGFSAGTIRRRRIPVAKARSFRAIGAATLVALLALAALAPAADAQGSRKDDVVLGTTGHPVANATVRVCQAGATGAPCTPLAALFTDATMTVASPNPFQADGLGNYHFYAPAARYVVQITGPGITGTISNPDVILPADISSGLSGSDISAFGLTLGGNLSVAGNATISGTLTSGTFSPGTFAPASIQVGGNGCFAGPRPTIDVTCPPYGAKGDSSTDDTAAIQAAITAACNTKTALNNLAMIPAVVFPPGIYRVQQPQTPSASPVFTISCQFLELRGFPGGNAESGGAPASSIIVLNGASPNAAPVFLAGPGSGGFKIRDLGVQGYNEAVWLRSTSAVRFDNAPLTCQGATGLADNTCLKISNTIEVWRTNGSSLNSANGDPSYTTPTAIYTNEPSLGSEAPITAFVYTENVVDSGGSEEFIQRANPTAGGSGTFVFRNVILEGANNGFMQVLNTSGNFMGAIGPFTFEDTVAADASTSSVGFLSINDSFATPGSLSGVHIFHSAGQTPVVLAKSGHIVGYSLEGCYIQCSQDDIVDANGNTVGTGTTTEQFGARDHMSDSAYQVAYPTAGLFYSSTPSISDRWAESGSKYAVMGVDANYGFLFGLGDANAFNAGLKQTSPETLDVQFANTLPPTSFSGSATTGGTLAANTYYAAIWSSTAGACATLNSSYTPAAGVVVGGSNNAINFSWTAPAATVSTPAGYCISIQTSPFVISQPASTYIFVSGAGATTFAYTGQSQTASSARDANVMQSIHRFTPTSLGVDTTNPQFNLDVNGSAAVNSLNGVQKAERFPGSDAAAKINACLTAASTSSGVCDAYGLIGTQTGASHIQIPAGTTLLWGSAQLTINDTTHNDAVELLGDGSSLISYQESGAGTVPRADSSGFIACQPTGCTAVKNPNAATRNVDWVHISGMYLKATGASSTVLNLTSVGHADIENNRFVMGTGGASYGIFGDTSTGGFDSTNTLIKHNEFDPQFQNDRCLHLAGIFNVVEMEQNTCILPASNTGTVCFELAKDSGGNYPNNDEFYGNDCEGSTTSFGQIGYNIINADSVTIGPNNRCENVYNCFQFPVDGSAVGIHILDPYISVSANSVIKANEPSTAQVAIDNNGPNWLPSMHFGMNDLAGRNLLGNAAFEGWSSSTALYYWGGVSSTNINQAGSGIYAQNTSAGTPADATTQGTYNVKIGDNATAGLGVNSGCVQVDATMNYTLAFRVAASSTGINFRPGFRFYSDPNCTEADKITNVATNARVLTPANYSGTSVLIGTGPNWQSSNASLTYNNGITCNCNVTGADWQVATASTWTPTRNFAITFRVPNAYSSSTTVAQSMRVFILENTAANPNQIFVDDAVLSQGPVSNSVPLTAAVSDSVNPTVYGNLNVNGALTVSSCTGCSAGGGVSSVALALPSSVFGVSGSPDTSSGTLTGTFNTQTANTLFAGPSSGSAAAPTFRALVGADLPAPSASTLGGVQSAAAVSHQWINSISTSGVPALGQPAFGDISGTIATGQLPSSVTLTTGSPVAGNCAAFASMTTNVQDSGSPCPTLFTKFAMGFLSAGQAPSATNAVDVSVIYLPNIQFSHLTVDVSTTDSSTSDFYSWAITDASGNVKCSITAVNVTAGGADDQACTQGTVTLAAGAYVFAFTGNATAGKIAYSGTAPLALSSAVSSSTSSSGTITFPITVPSAGVTYSGYGLPAIILH
jgi:Pectate lyase superfamily protein